MARITFALTAIAAVLAQSASAETASDAKSGLRIDPPAGYEAKPLPARGANAVIFQVKKPSDADTGCQVGYAEAPQNAGLAQADINTLMKSKEHQEVAKTAIASLYQTNSVEPFDHGEVTGIEMISDIKPREGFPPRAQEIRNMMIILETPKGRASVVCVGEKKDFDQRRAEFHQLAQGVTLPK